MNTIYSIVWNAARGTWVVASELARKGKKTKSKTRRGLVLASLVMLPMGAWGACDPYPTVSDDGSQIIVCTADPVDPRTPMKIDYSLGRMNKDNNTQHTDISYFYDENTKVIIEEQASIIREHGPAISKYNGTYGMSKESAFTGIGTVDYSNKNHWKDLADILISDGATVQNIHFNKDEGFHSAGPNTIETANDTLIYIGEGAKVISSAAPEGGDSRSEVINVMGFNNLIINYGSVYTEGVHAALWFEDKLVHTSPPADPNSITLPYLKRTDNSEGINYDLRNQVYNYGYLGVLSPELLKMKDGQIVTDKDGSLTLDSIDQDKATELNYTIKYGFLYTPDNKPINFKGNVFGSQGQKGAEGIIIGNYGTIVGSLSFGIGDDTLEMFSGSKIYGDITAKGGTNHIGLRGKKDTIDSFDGNITGFQYLTKADEGTWEINGKLGNFAQVDVHDGRLILSEDNSDYEGIMLINAEMKGTTYSVKDESKKNTAIVEAHSSSLPENTDGATRIYNNGTLLFNQDLQEKIVKDNTYSGKIIGEGKVEKTGEQILILTGDSDYAGGTTIKQGDLQLGNGGTTGSVTGKIAIEKDSSLIFNYTDYDGEPGTDLSHASGNLISGEGSVVKEGKGELKLTNKDNSYKGGTVINAGTLSIDDDSVLGADDGSITFNGGTLKFLNSVDENGKSINFTGINKDRAITLKEGGGTIDTNDNNSTISQVIKGKGALTKAGVGELILTGINEYEGDTNLKDGDLTLEGAGWVAGNINLANDKSTLTFNNDENKNFSKIISGTGLVEKIGGNILTLSGNSTWTGNTTVKSGMLIVNGDLSKDDDGNTQKKMTTTINSGATLGGYGTVGGSVVIGEGATLRPGSDDNGNDAVGNLTIDGKLTLAKTSTSEFQLGQTHAVGGALNDLVDVKGDLQLGGTLNVTVPNGGTFGPGVYRLFNYSGELSNADQEAYKHTETGEQTLSFGKFPDEKTKGEHFLQTIIKNQVNLVNTNGINLQFWDGDDTSNHGTDFISGNTSIDGGDGTWTGPVGSTNKWTGWDGNKNAPWEQAAFAVFAGNVGNVTVDNSPVIKDMETQQVKASGMQFLTDGYTINGKSDTDTLEAHYTLLVPNVDANGKPAEGVTKHKTQEFWIRVGASASDTGITATLNVPLVQADKSDRMDLVKLDGGRLILNGENDYNGETHVRGGTLQISKDEALGDKRVVMSDATTLQAGDDFTLNHEVNLKGGTGTLDLNNHALTMVGEISGDGSLAVMSSPQESDSTLLQALADDYGPSVLNLTQANTYTGSTTITGNGDTVNQVTVNAYQTGALGGTADSKVSVNNGATLNLLGSTSAQAHNIAVNASHLNLKGNASAGTAKVALTSNATASLNDNATAGSSTITVDNSSSLTLADNANGGNATITNSGKMFMKDKAQARQATVVNEKGGTVDVSGIDKETAIGSLSGAGNVLLGDDENKTLTLGYLAKADTISGIISGAGNLIKEGLGVLDLRGANTWTGTTQVNEGTLLVNGKQPAATGDMTVANNATLGGMGTHGGVVTVEDGGILSPGETPDSIGTLTLGGLVFKEGSQLDIQFSQPTPDYSADDTRLSHDATDVEYYAGYILGDAFNNDLVRVEGDLTLDGTLNIKQEQPLTIAGVYRVMNYSGDLTDNGMELGGNLDNLENYYIQTAVEQQVNLVYTNGLKLRFWDGEGTRNKFIDGGNGTWQNSLGNNNWTVDEKDSDGNYGVRNAAYSDNAFAIFMAQGGDVKVDNSLGQVGVSGMQFAADGYHLYGDNIALTATWPDYSSDNGIINIKDGEIEHTDATPAVNYTALVVGDGTDALYTATIDNVLTGDSGIVKMGNGTLVLNGDNEYTGKTRVHGGELVISGDNNLGHDASGVTDVILNSGTLKYNPDLAAQDIDTLASITVEGVGGTLDTSQHTVKVHKKVVGDGALTKKGEGAAVLLDNATYTGGTHIAQGVLQLGIGGTAGGLMGDVVIDKDAELVVNRSDTLTLDGKLSGEGDLSQVGSGTTLLNGSASYSGTTTVAAGTLLAGAENSFSYASAHAVAKGATLNTGGMNQTVAGLDNSGLVTLRGDKVGSALTVKGDYHGDSGTIQLNATQQGTSGDGVADRLVIDGGKATGTTVLDVDISKVKNRTRGNGIEVVSGVNGAETTAQSSKDAFRLTADYLQSGAMKYRLRAGDRNGAGENWYLVNNFSNEASLFSAINSQIRFADLAMLGNLHQRVGDDVAYSENGDNQRVWVRMISRMDKIGLNDATETSTTNYSLGLQAGVDLYADPNWKAGLYTSFVDNNSSVRGWGENGYGDTGNVKDNAFYVGGYATWFADNGFYVDNVLQYGFHNLRVIPKNAGSQSYNPDAHSLAASVEVGQPFRLGESAWQLEPQAQLIYQFNHVDGASMDGISRTDMKVKDGNAVTARIGARLVGDYDTDKGKFQPYGRVNLWQGFGGTDKVTFSNSGGNTTLSSSKQFSTTEVAAGVTWTVQKDFQVYGEVGSHFSNSSDKTNYRTPVEASIGVKFGF